ncbi:hypothetical protein [Chamaesiphon minutus]|uniref:Uncharacterized protein n=1 Tax=Chamaesiphon minutus (strain ATCC 27169 / PCC 6605) TaxID=1173020 RepID=K9UF85_CHAP6|nr:hypothetical protein [Chamaesiphon minutus]AFY93293.1 hypothetical protein Cha6605_2210 [Chamaesiphon minutus PCC 6605]
MKKLHGDNRGANGLVRFHFGGVWFELALLPAIGLTQKDENDIAIDPHRKKGGDIWSKLYAGYLELKKALNQSRSKLINDVINLEYTHDNPDRINFDDALFDGYKKFVYPNRKVTDITIHLVAATLAVTGHERHPEDRSTILKII